MGYTFEWDPGNAEANLKKHGISFNQASTVLGGPLSLLMQDPDDSADEERYHALAKSARQTLLAVAARRAAAEHTTDLCKAGNAV